MELDIIIEKLGKYINFDYLITNSHIDMISLFGRSAAKTIHKSFYMDELISSGDILNYQHVSLICDHIFNGKVLHPITPKGFENGEGINAIDKLCYQGHEQNLSEEIVKGTLSKANGITNSIFFGKKPKMGTNYINFSLDHDKNKEIMDSHAEAKKEQIYFKKFEGVNLSYYGPMKHLTTFDKNFHFANNLTGK